VTNCQPPRRRDPPDKGAEAERRNAASAFDLRATTWMKAACERKIDSW